MLRYRISRAATRERERRGEIERERRGKWKGKSTCVITRTLPRLKEGRMRLSRLLPVQPFLFSFSFIHLL